MNNVDRMDSLSKLIVERRIISDMLDKKYNGMLFKLQYDNSIEKIKKEINVLQEQLQQLDFCIANFSN